MRIGVMLTAAVIVLTPSAAGAQTLADGYAWQKSSMDERKAYLVGVSNLISVGARFDTRAGLTNSFSQRAQSNLTGAQLGTAVDFVDGWYRTHPSDLNKPVLSVIWAQIAKQSPYSK